MEVMKEAFAKAGLSASIVSFATACHDLARLALNKQPDPARAVHAWLGMASGQMFRDGPLKDFLAAVFAERAVSSSSAGERGQLAVGNRAETAPISAETFSGDARGQRSPATHLGAASPSPETPSEAAPGDMSNDAQIVHARPVSEPHPASARGQVRRADQAFSAPAPAGTSSGGGSGQIKVDSQNLPAAPPPGNPSERTDHSPLVHHPSDVGSLAPRSPTPEQLRAAAKARADAARVMSGIYISDRAGRRMQVDDLAVAGLDYRVKAFGRRAAKGAVEYNMLVLINEHAKRQAFVPPRSTVGDIMAAHEIRHMHDMARAFASSPMIQLPEGLRSELEGIAA